MAPEGGYSWTGHIVEDSADCWHAGGLTFWNDNNPIYLILLRMDSLELRIRQLEEAQHPFGTWEQIDPGFFQSPLLDSLFRRVDSIGVLIRPTYQITY